jgi:solute carrier family 25 (mitochondrial citrate transporter), member 1
MQSINARSDYGNSFKCAWTIYKQEGILAFWSGATPRLARLLLSGGIVFTVYVALINVLPNTASRYEKVIEIFESVDPDGKYI